jgi:AraC family transcriptional activator of mtrCDE
LEAAFQRAFKGHMGITPAQWRKMREVSGQDVFARLAVPGDANPMRAGRDDPTDEPRPAREGDAPA